MTFKKLESKPKSAYVIDQIVRAIQEGEYKIGERLPSERIIAEQIGVSRPSVREALISLQLAGIVERRQGNGTFIRGSKKRAISRAYSFLEETKNISEIFELQKVLEIGVAELATEKAEVQNFTEIENALNQMRIAIEEKDCDKWFAGDRAFHLAIAKATANSLIEKQINSLIDRMNRDAWRESKRYYLESQSEYLNQSFEDHRQILDALKRKDKKLVKNIMEKHFIRIQGVIFDDINLKKVL
jgi:GntR family transcriptional repressor for pyruvate dehydrogenase complex